MHIVPLFILPAVHNNVFNHDYLILLISKPQDHQEFWSTWLILEMTHQIRIRIILKEYQS